MKNKKIFTTIITTITVIMVVVMSFIIYDKVTSNNEYYIYEKNINIPVFVYHNIVSSNEEIQYDYMQTTKEIFEKQIKGLKNAGYHFIDYNDLQEYKYGKKKLFKKSCILTFDDGCKGVYENAFPIAVENNISFTMFIINNSMGKDGVITWEQAKEMDDSGLVTIASHSLGHEDFRNLSGKEAVDNVNTSYKEIEEKLGYKSIKIFTYPYGLYNEEQIGLLEKEGYIQNLTDNKINKSSNINLSGIHRSYPLNDNIYKILIKILYRSIRYN